MYAVERPCCLDQLSLRLGIDDLLPSRNNPLRQSPPCDCISLPSTPSGPHGREHPRVTARVLAAEGAFLHPLLFPLGAFLSFVPLSVLLCPLAVARLSLLRARRRPFFHLRCLRNTWRFFLLAVAQLDPSLLSWRHRARRPCFYSRGGGSRVYSVGYTTFILFRNGTRAPATLQRP